MKLLPAGAAETRSVWTIDLAYGLKNSGFSDFFCTTISNCVDPAHEELGFYTKVMKHKDDVVFPTLTLRRKKNHMRLSVSLSSSLAGLQR